MALPVIPGVMRVTLDWQLSTGPNGHNVLHFAGIGSEADLFAALGANLTGDMQAAMSSASGLIGIDILPLDGASGTTSHTLDGTSTGLASGDPLIAPAAIISLFTGLAGPRHRGRVFLPFPGEGAVNSGFVLGTVRSDMQDAWEAFRVAMAADDWPLQVASYTHADTNDVTAVAARSVLGTQKRRVDQLH